jgi:hypothetical protein
MLVRFTKDFQSARTDEQFYRAGATADLAQGPALIAEGVAEFVPIDARIGQAQPKPPTLKPVARGKQNR